MSEVRPWVGSFVSVAEFVTLRDLKLVNCSRTEIAYWENPFNPQQPTGTQVEQSVWHDINEAFSEPVTPTDGVADYAPTQVLSEVFRSAGFDGVIYSSKLGPGKTFALFDIESAELMNCYLYQVGNVKHTFIATGDPYFVSKYYPDAPDEKHYLMPLEEEIDAVP